MPVIATRRPVQSIDPNSGEVWGEHSPATPEEVRLAVDAARSAQPGWASLPLKERARAIVRFRDALYRRRSEVASLLERETGKPNPEAMLEITGVADAAMHAAKHAPRVLGPTRFRSRSVATLRKTIEIRREPWGVVAIIAPWNYPLLLAASPMITSLVGGNGVVLKPSEFTPATGLLLGELFEEAGLPPGLLSVVTGDGQTGASLIESGVDQVIFTGSAATGRIVAETCGRRLIPLHLELGGSDPAIVLEDADIPTTAAGIVWGRFSNSGQTCTAAKRVFAVDSIHDGLVDELARQIGNLRLSGAEREMGAVIRPQQKELLEQLRDDAIGSGGRVAFESPGTAAAGFMAPSLLIDLPPEARALREETFGPILPVVRVQSGEEAVRLANQSDFGLSASIWTADMGRARKLARDLQCGTVMINDVVVVAGLAEAPHGGVKASGIGRMHGIEGILESTRVKAVIEDPFPRWRQVWWFPYTAGVREGLDRYLTFAHGRGLWNRVRNGIRAVRLLYFR
ncbi:MAG: aldehyde dehydrogenase family protein [Thermoanaerobaculia bacterium]